MQLELMVKKQNINIQKQNSVLRQQAKKLNYVNELSTVRRIVAKAAVRLIFLFRIRATKGVF